MASAARWRPRAPSNPDREGAVRSRMIAFLATLAVLAAAGCSAEPAPGTAVPPVAADTGAAVPEADRPEWDSDRARAIWADARARGASFRGIGQEPGWHLELFERDSIVFVTDYGETRVVTAWPDAPAVDGTTARVVLDARTAMQTVRVTVERRACHDSMSGQPFDFTVTVTLDGVAHDGCGRAL